jgi:hypothetical protein
MEDAVTSVAVSPVSVNARLDAPLSRWLWLLKWLLVLPHVVVLGFLWIAFAVLSIVAFFAILITGRYPWSIFEFNVGVLRWSWRVAFYTYGALGTDRYPPFTLGEAPGYPATLDVAYPQHLSRGLVLVKWWLLALPHYLILAFFVGGGTYAASRAGSWSTGSGASDGWSSGGGLIGLLALIAGVALLFTGRYPRGVFDLLLGMQRWVLRVAAYSALMTDAYPPFRLDMGGAEPSTLAVPPGGATLLPESAPTSSGSGQRPRGDYGPAGSSWSAGRATAVVAGSVLVLLGVGAAAGGAVALTADRGARDADGFVTTGARGFTSIGYALLFDPIELHGSGPAADPDALDLDAVLGDVRVRATAAGPGAFVGIGPVDAVAGYLTTVDRDRLIDLRSGQVVQQRLPGGAPATPPAQQTFWVASAAGPGTQQLTWTPTDGRWVVAVMNADGSRPVDVELSAGATLPHLRWLWIGLFVGAALALVVGAVLVVLAVRRRPSV